MSEKEPAQLWKKYFDRWNRDELATSGIRSLVFSDDVTADRSSSMNSKVRIAILSCRSDFPVQMIHSILQEPPKSFSVQRNGKFLNSEVSHQWSISYIYTASQLFCGYIDVVKGAGWGRWLAWHKVKNKCRGTANLTPNYPASNAPTIPQVGIK